MKISSIMITYNPDFSKFSEVIKKASEIFEFVYIFDNASTNVIDIEKLACNFENVLIEKSSDNVGISGLNFLASRAFSSGSNVISIIDQDSVLPFNFYNKVESFFIKYPEAVCAPIHADINLNGNFCFRYLFSRFRIKKEKIIINDTIDEYIETDFCIGSGMTISKSVWNKIGGFDGSFFIDCADLDFCIRLHIEKIKIYLIANCTMKHEIGSQRESVLFFNVSMHKPIRHYYYFYSILTLLSRKTTPLCFKLHYISKLFVQYIVYSFLVNESKLHRREINRAILEFFVKK